MIEPYGSDPNGTPCGGSRGCCGSCFQSGFDEDEFDKADRRADERRQKEKERSEETARSKETKENRVDELKEKDEAVAQAAGESGANGDGKSSPPPNAPEAVPDIVVHQPSPMPAMNNTTPQ